MNRPDAPAVETPGHKGPPDPWQPLLDGYHAGNSRAFDRLVRALIPELVTYCRTTGVPAWDADDVVNDTLATVWIHRGEPGEDMGRFRARVFATLRNDIMHARRGHARRARREVPADPLTTAPADGTPEDTVADHERERLMADAVQKLPRALRRVVTLRLEGLSWEDMVRVLSREEERPVTQRTARDRYDLALREMKARLSRCRMKIPEVAVKDLCLGDMVMVFRLLIPNEPAYADLHTACAEMLTTLARDAARQGLPAPDWPLTAAVMDNVRPLKPWYFGPPEGEAEYMAAQVRRSRR